MCIYGSAHIRKPTSVNENLWKLDLVYAHIQKRAYMEANLRICAFTKVFFRIYAFAEVVYSW
jgi:predicted nuclease of restriction endonuclease-like (RecB) superfamily